MLTSKIKENQIVDVSEEQIQSRIEVPTRILRRWLCYLNPFWHLFVVICYVRRNVFSYNWDKVTEMSGIVDIFPPEIRQKLTIVIDSNIIPPQHSFIYFFINFDLTKVDVEIFKYKFIELWQIKGFQFLKTFEESKDKDEETIFNFWKSFESALKLPQTLDLMPSSQIFLASFFQKLRRLKRTIFSGFRVN